ncbi:malate:quinone oxidoreductase [Prescottella equi]|uniref:malate:quinone oxidoreductase n=1 Tax=Rhodococcus hoagii TaxID=43767 RepID=UPI000A103771|nr:malate:quinone oxidoreductase [Prescottella equi]NKR39696.1 FAD-dependent oxidoreductase [Prescottella equi]NKR72518.1 FAD-dependent oxidoreductase [Prescottella equi]NKS15984.1 FAD-dependent oxidoreductase [Prescottella equi]ORJ93713.1 malate:quinone oxidoreductase [Prescottella equi]
MSSTPFDTGQSLYEELDADVILIGGGIMSATLGSILAVLQPDWRIIMLEKTHGLATESSGPWNNAGTGHSGYCELNYMPDPADGRKATTIARQFHLSRRWWAHLARTGLLDPSTFIHTVPHMDVVFGADDIDYLRKRFETLTRDPVFDGLEYSDDPATIGGWAPLTVEGRDRDEPMAATRHADGTDVDFGALTAGLTRIVTDAGGRVLLGHDVRSLRRAADGIWTIRGKAGRGRFELRGRRVFVGAGGMALRLLQRAHLPEVRGYAVLPVGAAFYRCSTPAVVARHDAKVYGQADIGAPPMSVPHLDKRVIDGTEHLLFGPYATFSTKLLKNGRPTDFFTTLRWHNLHVIAAALIQNLSLMRYLISELVAGPRKKFAKLQRFYPTADVRQWQLVFAGQRAQLVTPDRRRIGVLQQGTELVVGDGGSIAGLLGASPGASTAVPIMLDLLERCFPDEWHTSWSRIVTDVVDGDVPPSDDSVAATAIALGLDAGRRR